MIRGGGSLALLVAPFVLIVATMTAQPSAAQELPDPAAAIDSLQGWDQAIEGLQRTAEALQSSRSYFGEDIRGLHIDEDWSARILTPQTQATLKALRATAETQAGAGDQRGLRATITTAAPLIRAEARKALLLSAYWRDSAAVRLHRDLLMPWLEGESDYVRETMLRHIATTQQSLLDEMERAFASPRDKDSAKAVEQMQRIRQNAAVHYNVNRMEFAHRQAGSATTPPLLSRARTSPCGPPVSPVAGIKAPRFVTNTVDPEEWYPPLAKLNHVGGIVLVEVEVSDTGCAQRATVIRTSGATILDEAALLMAQAAKYQPPMSDGKAVAATLRFNVRFR